MRFHAATTGEQQPKSSLPAPIPVSRKRSSAMADTLALLAALILLGANLWSRGAVLLHSGKHLYAVIGITAVFAVAARMVHGVSTSGALSGAAVAFIMASRDLRLFIVLLTLFFITFAATRAGSSSKRRIKIAEAESGRSASQVMANLGVATLALAIPSFSPGYLLALAALAEVAADTTSSEIGAGFSANAMLITTGKAVPPGTDGGISLTGTAAGVIASLLTAGCAAALGLTSIVAALVMAFAGIGGMLVDSLLGAALERRGYLNNDTVNLLGTISAATMTWIISAIALGP